MFLSNLLSSLLHDLETLLGNEEFAMLTKKKNKQVVPHTHSLGQLTRQLVYHLTEDNIFSLFTVYLCNI